MQSCEFSLADFICAGFACTYSFLVSLSGTVLLSPVFYPHCQPPKSIGCCIESFKLHGKVWMTFERTLKTFVTIRKVKVCAPSVFTAPLMSTFRYRHHLEINVYISENVNVHRYVEVFIHVFIYVYGTHMWVIHVRICIHIQIILRFSTHILSLMSNTNRPMASPMALVQWQVQLWLE